MGTIALIGPSADVLQLGDYSGAGVQNNFISTLDGISAKVPQAEIYHVWYYTPVHIPHSGCLY